MKIKHTKNIQLLTGKGGFCFWEVGEGVVLRESDWSRSEILKGFNLPDGKAGLISPALQCGVMINVRPDGQEL